MFQDSTGTVRGQLQVNNTPVKPLLTSEVNTDSTDTVDRQTWFQVPFRSRYNPDSLLKEKMKKEMVLYYDTIEKGITSARPSDEIIANAYQKVYVGSLFKGHLLKVEKREPSVRMVESMNWLAFVLLFSFFLLGSLRVFYQKRLRLVLDAFFIPRYANQLMREENALTQRTSVFLSGIFVLSISLFFYQLNVRFKWILNEAQPAEQFIKILIMVLFFYGLRLIFNFVAGYIFKVQKEMSDYLFYFSLELQICGLAFLPLVTLSAFAHKIPETVIFVSGGLILTLAFVMRLMKGFSISLGQAKIPVIYIFLYICTLEVLPFMMIYKSIIRG